MTSKAIDAYIIVVTGDDEFVWPACECPAPGTHREYDTKRPGLYREVTVEPCRCPRGPRNRYRKGDLVNFDDNQAYGGPMWHVTKDPRYAQIFAMHGAEGALWASKRLSRSGVPHEIRQLVLGARVSR